MSRNLNEPLASYHPRTFVGSASGSPSSTPLCGIVNSRATPPKGVLMALLVKPSRSTGVGSLGLSDSRRDRTLLAALRGATGRCPASRGQELRAAEVRSAPPIASLQADRRCLVGPDRSSLPRPRRRGRRHLRLVLDRKPRRLRPAPLVAEPTRPPNQANRADETRCFAPGFAAHPQGG